MSNYENYTEMKKLVLTAIVALALAAASCGTKSTQEVSASDIKTKIENCSNPDSLKVYVDQAKDYAKAQGNRQKQLPVIVNPSP